ncbi:MAG TPA: SUMF1/EgtB/PvdO family nonheme iron enzyme [Thermoanaerobaculia bacterium]|nr:SUMF1/EgtB/PvdO family nonheme iron enzyme [Thermoanaerobaculia bacterium]
MPDRYAAFISYAHRYAPWVRALQTNLEKCLAVAGRPGEVFLDQTDLASGRSWVTQLQAGIDRSEHFILIATPEALASPRVGDEWGTFLSLRREWLAQGRLHIALLVDTPIPPFLMQTQRVDFLNAREAKYRVGIQELVAGLSRHSDRRNLPALPTDLEIPPPPDPGLDPQLRARLVKWLTPVLAKRVLRLAVAAGLRREPAELDGQPSDECRASALLVWESGNEEPVAAAIRILDALRETLEEDEPTRVAELLPLRADLVARQKKSPERGLLEIWLAQVVADHERLVPYFQQQAEVDLLERVYVELEMRSEERRSSLAESALGSEGVRAGQPLGLREVLALPREENPWISGRWIVLGDPGAGKTTLLRHLTATLARQADRPLVPLFESLPKLLRNRDSLLDRVVRRMERAGHPAQGLAAALDREGKDGHLLLLLDGLDEVPREERDDAEKLLRDIAIRWPTTPIVVASRPIGYRPPGGDFREVRLLPLDRERRREFLARWLGRTAGRPDEARAETALVALDGPELRDLAGNPLYLTLMALLFEQNTEPARHRTELYDQVFKLLLEGKHRTEERPIEAQEAVRAALRCLASDMTCDNRDAEPVTEIEARLYRQEMNEERETLERVPRWRGRLRQFLDDLSEQTGILGPHDGANAHWRFWHRTFREALASERLEIQYRAKDGKAAVLARAAKITAEEDLSAWAEPYALLAGRLDAPDELVKDLVKENRSLGLRSVATAQRLRPETLREILELSDDWEERVKVFQRIPDLVGGPRRALALLDQLRRGTTNGNDLFFLDHAVREVGRRSPDHVREAEDLAVRLYDHLSRPDENLFLSIETPNGDRIPLWRKIPAGVFWMGSSEEESLWYQERLRHRVTIARPFAMAAVTVTNAQYRSFDPTLEPFPWEGVTADELLIHPVVKVTWYEAVSFCRWLASCFPWAHSARLPLEEEWEYACRAGSETPYWSGETDKNLAQVGWYQRNSKRRVHRVCEKGANPWGLFDMHGNVWNWTLSPWTDNYEGHEVEIDPLIVDVPEAERKISSGEGSAVRGGSYWYDAAWVRAANRSRRSPDFVSDGRGFRVVLPIVPEFVRREGD